MNKILASILFYSIFFLLFTKPSFAQQGTWTKYSNNPVLNSGNVGDWDSKGRLMPTVIYDNGIYKMWFVGANGLTNQIGYATSNDGINWSTNPSNPVLSPDPSKNEQYLSEASVIKDPDENLYKIWFTTVYPGGIYKINYAYSNDGIHWTRINSPVLVASGWETNNAVAVPSVIKIGTTYHMLYNGNNGTWKVGYAYSQNGINWTKNPSPVIIKTEPWENNNIGRPSLVQVNDIFQVYYHTGDPNVIGYALSINNSFINWSKPLDNPVFQKGGGFESLEMKSPYVVYISSLNQLKMWYGGNDGNKWSIGLATKDLGPPKPVLKPLVLLPGLFGSWNKEAVLDGKEVSQDKWGPLPFINAYDNLVNAFVANGYEKEGQNKNLFVFNYDWRKPLAETTDIFKNYLEQNVFSKYPNEKIYIVGHSLGGLVGRSYLQEYGNNQIEELISVGSPHSGALPSYKIWEGGEVDTDNFLDRLGVDIIIGLNRKGYRTNKDVVREMVPVIKDILPTFDYLKDSTNSIVNVSSLKNQNTYLNSLESGFPDIFDTFYSMYGHGKQTEEWYQVAAPSFIEKLLGLWQDGKPINTEYSDFGDGTVLTKSATRSADIAYQEPGLNHIDLVSSKEGITEILEALKIQTPASPNPVPTPPVYPALFVAIQSPATFTLTGPSGSFDSKDIGAVLITNTISSSYNIKVTGTDSGFYHLVIGEFGNLPTNWKEIVGDIKLNEVDNYTIEYNPNNSTDPLLDPTGMVHFDNAYNRIKNLKERYPHFSLSIALNSFDKAKQQIAKKNYKDVSNLINNIIKNLSLFRKKFTIADALNPTFEATDDLITSYDKILSNYNSKINPVKVFADIAATKGIKLGIEQKLKIKGNEKNAQIYQHASQILDNAEISYNFKNYKKAELEVITAKTLFLEVE